MLSPALQQGLGRFAAADAQTLQNWLLENPIGDNLALQLLELLADLIKKEGRPLSDWMAELPAPDQRQPKERARAWRLSLERRLHPHRSRHAEAFAAEVRHLGLPPGVSVEPPQNFEGRRFTLAIGFSDKEELRSRLEALQQALAGEGWEKLWKF